MPETRDTEARPRVGVGCIVMKGARTLLVKSRRGGCWSTPGGNLEFGESPAECARRETAEETGITVGTLDFLAITNDVMPERGTHYITIWMLGEAEAGEIRVADRQEISEAGWFSFDSLPEPVHPYFANLVEGRLLQTSAPIPFEPDRGSG